MSQLTHAINTRRRPAGDVYIHPYADLCYQFTNNYGRTKDLRIMRPRKQTQYTIKADTGAEAATSDVLEV